MTQQLVKGDRIPQGVIVMWSGLIANIPAGWGLCNGSNGTPDLRNKFIVGADADSGGAAKSTVVGAAAQSGGSIAHDHNFYEQIDAETAGVTDPSSHDYNSGTFGPVPQVSDMIHTHSFSYEIDHATEEVTTVPPFFALAYIMKL